MYFWFVGPCALRLKRKCSSFMGAIPRLSTSSRKCTGEHVRQHVERCISVDGVAPAGRYPTSLSDSLALLLSTVQADLHSSRTGRVARCQAFMPENALVVAKFAAGSVEGIAGFSMDLHRCIQSVPASSRTRVQVRRAAALHWCDIVIACIAHFNEGFGALRTRCIWFWQSIQASVRQEALLEDARAALFQLHYGPDSSDNDSSF